LAQQESALEKYRRISGGGGAVATPQPAPEAGSPLEQYRRITQGASATPEPTVGEIVRKTAKGIVPLPVRTTVGAVLELLSRPSAALAGASLAAREGRDRSDAFFDNLAGRRKDSFIDVAKKDFGADSKLATPIGLAADITADPLNFTGGALLKSVQAGGKLLRSGAAAVLPEAIQRVGTGIEKALGEKFIPRYGTELTEADRQVLDAAGKTTQGKDEFKDSLRQFQKERSTVPARREQDIIERYKGTEIAQRDSQTGVLEALEAGASKTALVPDVDKLADAQRKINDELFEREVRAGVMKPEAYNPDYAPHDFSRSKGATARAMQNPQSALNAKNRFARRRKDPEQTIQEAVAAGAADDIALAQLTREIKGETAALTGEFVQQTAKRFGLPVKQAPSDWEVLKLPMEKPLAEQVAEVAFPSYIARELNKMFDKPKAATMLGQMYDKALRLWRTQATVLRPGFHSTNMQGNAFNGALLAGALHPARYIEAAAWDAAKAKGFAGAPKIGRYAPDEVDEFMRRFGVGGAGHGFTSELLEEGADKVLLEKIADVGGKSLGKKMASPLRHPVRSAQHFGQRLEDFSKRALFLDQLHKGKSLEDAAKTVDKYLFDYSDLTDFEKKVARRIFPFYTWMRKNVPLQMEQVLEQPGKYAAVAKTQNAIERQAQDDGSFVRPEERLEYLQRNNAVQIGAGEDGQARFWTPYLPFADLNKVPIPGGSDPLAAGRDVVSGLEPITKAVLELLQNKSLFFNRPVFDEQLGPFNDTQPVNDVLKLLPDAVQKLLFSQGPKGSEVPAIVRYGISQFPLVEGLGKSAVAITKPEDASNPYSPQSFFTGVRVTQRTKEQVRSDKRNAKRAAVNKARKERAQNPPKAKVKALYERYQQEQ